MENSEYNLHIFLTCPQVLPIWQNIATHYGFALMSFSSISEAFKKWSNMYKDQRAIALLVIWAIWKWRNGRIFRAKKDTYESVVASVISLHNSLGLDGMNRIPYGRSKMSCSKSIRNEGDPLLTVSARPPCAFFDRAAQQGICACGVFIRTAKYQTIEINWNAGLGSNNGDTYGTPLFLQFSQYPQFENLWRFEAYH